MAEAERRLLARKAHGAGLRLVAGENLHLRLLAPRGKRRIKLVHAVEMILDHALVAAGNEDEMLDAGFLGLVDHILDQRLVDDGQHFLRHCLGRGQYTGAEASDGKDGFADFHGRATALCETLGNNAFVTGLEPGTKADLAPKVPDRGKCLTQKTHFC